MLDRCWIKMYLQYLAVLALATFAVSLRIYQDTIHEGNDVKIPNEALIVNPGVYWSVLNNQVNKFKSSITVGEGAGLYFVQTYQSYLDLQVTTAKTSASIENHGTMVFDSSYVAQSDPTYTLTSQTFINTGLVFLGTSGQKYTKKGTTFTVAAYPWTNTGAMEFYLGQQNVQDTLVRLGSGPLVTNNGLVCFHNTIFYQACAVEGSGCITADGAGIINIDATFAVNNTIWMSGADSVLVVRGGTNDTELAVAGFGARNTIGLATPLATGNPYTYSGSILTLYPVSGSPIKLDIGTGYASNEFIVADVVWGRGKNDMARRGAVKYTGTVPGGANKPLSQCQPCAAVPFEPGFDDYT